MFSNGSNPFGFQNPFLQGMFNQLGANPYNHFGNDVYESWARAFGLNTQPSGQNSQSSHWHFNYPQGAYGIFGGLGGNPNLNQGAGLFGLLEPFGNAMLASQLAGLHGLQQNLALAQSLASQAYQPYVSAIANGLQNYAQQFGGIQNQTVQGIIQQALSYQNALAQNSALQNAYNFNRINGFGAMHPWAQTTLGYGNVAGDLLTQHFLQQLSQGGQGYGWNPLTGSGQGINPGFGLGGFGTSFGSQFGSQGSQGLSPFSVANGLWSQGLQGINTFLNGFSQPVSIDGRGQNLGTDWQPVVDVIEKPESIIVRANVPGYKGSEVDVYIEGNVLVIRGQRSKSDQINTDTFHMAERQQGSFYRRLSLPYFVDAGDIKAHLSDGVLELNIPKSGKNQVSLGEVKSTKVKVA